MTTQYTAISNLPYPQPSDPADLPAHLKSLAEAADGRLVMRFADEAARDAVITAPVSGMVAWAANPGRLSVYTAAGWQPVGSTPVHRVNLDGGSTTSTAYTETLTDALGDPMKAEFIAPAAGQVIVTVGAYMYSSVNSNGSIMSANIRKLDGTVHLAAHDDRSALTYTTSRASLSAQFLVSGLTPGTRYNAIPAYRSSATANSAFFDMRFVRIDPVN
ncbi:hypothetical protein ACFQLX_02665 [Streptomyces polyrhachis]|uniref:DUF4082 domain-containing protein n=1 Tax=Streptomyces polyrhachis TaxID=1282885 RepID=A0ABW2GCS8_9ACTN